MEHQQLWAPWRLGYVSGADAKPAQPAADDALQWLAGADPQCFICRAVADSRDRDNLLVYRGRQVVVILNRYPYNNGHLLVAPQQHLPALDALADEVHLEIQHTIAGAINTLSQTMRAEGFNVGLNLGRIAGAGLPGHLHWHVVPRWNGDTNFMPVLAGIRVIPQSLEALWDMMHQALAPAAASGAGP